jgi:ribosome-binding ATPase
MRVTIVGLPYSGKSTLFTAISGLPRAQLQLAQENLAAVKVPEPRLDWLDEIYKPKKRTEATIEFVDLPGSSEGETESAGLTRHLPTLRQADALLIILRGFESAAVPTPAGGINPLRDLKNLRDEMLLADLVACDNRIEKLEKGMLKPSKERDQQKQELAVLIRCREALQNEKPLSDVIESVEDQKLLRSFGFLTQKKVVTTINVSEADAAKPPALVDPHAGETLNVCAPIEADIIQMDPGDRPMFMQEFGITALARDRIIRASYDALGMIAFLTAGEDEVRAWPIPRGFTAVEAAGKIHSDLARGFIRAETVAYADLKAAGSMRDAKAAGKVRQEPKTYVVQDGDVMNIKFAV